MTTQVRDPLTRIAEQVADSISACGYAFVEDDKIDGLAAVLRSFLTVAGIPVNTASGDALATPTAAHPL
jgi:hypothetical protein